VDRLLQKNPLDRFASADQCIQALEALGAPIPRSNTAATLKGALDS
jgi:hypothetical protein